MSRALQQLAKLNAIAENDVESTVEGQQPEDTSNPPLEEDYAMFSNTTFYDFDIGRSTNIATTVDELLMAQEKRIQYPEKAPVEEELSANSNVHAGAASASTSYLREQQKNEEHRALHLQGGFDFSLQEYSLAVELPPVGGDGGSYPTTATSGAHYGVPALTQQRARAQIEARERENQSFDPQLRPREVLRATSEESLEDFTPKSSSEEDKRRRNTAASARFRIKKKLREQEMERTARQAQQKIDDLEQKVRQLEMENRLLKHMADERSGIRNVASLAELRQQMLDRKNGISEGGATSSRLY